MYTCDHENECAHASEWGAANRGRDRDGGEWVGVVWRARRGARAGADGGCGEDFGAIRKGGGRRGEIVEGGDAAFGWNRHRDQRQAAGQRQRRKKPRGLCRGQWLREQRGGGDVYVRDEIAEPVLLRDAGRGQGLDRGVQREIGVAGKCARGDWNVSGAGGIAGGSGGAFLQYAAAESEEKPAGGAV